MPGKEKPSNGKLASRGCPGPGNLQAPIEGSNNVNKNLDSDKINSEIIYTIKFYKEDDIDPEYELISIEEKDKSYDPEKIKLNKNEKKNLLNIEHDKNIIVNNYEWPKENSETCKNELVIGNVVAKIKETLPLDMREPVNNAKISLSEPDLAEINRDLADLRRLELAALTNDNRLFFDVIIGSVKIKALVDTGSNSSYLGPKFYEFKPSNTAMINATGQISPITEKLKVCFGIDGNCGNIELKVTEGLKYKMVLV